MTCRYQARRPNGRFRRNRIEDLGVSVEVCTECGQLNPYSAGEPKPTRCSRCGRALEEANQ